MDIQIRDLSKADAFASIFHHIKLFTEYINIMFEPGRMFVQAMDSSRVSIFEIHLPNTWFDSYTLGSNPDQTITIGVNAVLLFKVLNARNKSQAICISQEVDETDKLCIDLTSEASDSFDLHYEIPLMDMDTELLMIPDIDYNAEFSLPSRHFAELIQQLKLFGDCMDIECSEESIKLSAMSQDCGKMSVEIAIDEVSSFSINEGETLQVSFGLAHLHNICLYAKLSKEIAIYLSDSYPIKIIYTLGQEDAKFVFYLAPKIRDD